MNYFKPGTRYRMPTVFGPAPGPRQRADGTRWTSEETGVMSAQWLTVRQEVPAAELEALMPPGFILRGDPVVAVQAAYFHNLYWLGGRSYGIVIVDWPVTYQGGSETIDGAFCPVMWEGEPDAIMTGREELGFPKLFADIPPLAVDPASGTASAEASWLGHRFFELSIDGLEESDSTPRMPGSGGANLYQKYMPRTGPNGEGGTDVSYVTTSAPRGVAASAAISIEDMTFRRWTGSGSARWHEATFQQLPTTHHIINRLAAIPVLREAGAEMVEFSGPGLAIAVEMMRVVDGSDLI